MQIIVTLWTFRDLDLMDFLFRIRAFYFLTKAEKACLLFLSVGLYFNLFFFVFFPPGFTMASKEQRRAGEAHCLANLWSAITAAERVLEGKPNWLQEQAKPKCLGGIWERG